MRPIFLILAFVVCTVIGAAQQPAPTTQPNQPIELPEVIVTGRETVDVPGSSKHVPSKPASIKGAILDSLNTFEKLPIPTLPPRPLPSLDRRSIVYPGYVDAQIGAYLTPDVKAGYSFVAGGYRVDLDGALEASNGWVTNGEYMKYGLHALSSYVAPEKFIFFGGSTTEVDAKVAGSSYKQYALTSAPSRTRTDLGLGVNTKGQYEGFLYDAGASWSSTSLSTTPGTVSDASFDVRAAVENRWNAWDVGGKVDLKFRSFADQAYPFMELQAYGRYASPDVRLTLGGGVQNAMSTSNVSRFGLLLFAQADYMLNGDLTLQATVRSGLRANSFTELFDSNPYVSSSVIMDAAYDVVRISGHLFYHPSMRLNITAGICVRSTERQSLWIADSNATFTAWYATVSTVTIPFDMHWLFTSTDAVVADMQITSATVSDAKAAPYIPTVRASVGYERAWTTDLRTLVSLYYVGDRWADLANTINLGGYVDVRIHASYQLLPSLSITLRAQNLIGSSITVWQGYQERGIFVSGGINWKF